MASASVDSAVAIRILPASSIHSASLEPESPAYLELSPRDWEGRSYSIADILATQAGIQTRRTGGMGSHQNISIRGFGANQIVICIDGVPLSSGHGGGVDLGQLDLSQFARIEVYKGQVPARFGGNGMGGVVNLVSHQAAQQQIRLHASYGSHGSQELSLAVAVPWSDSIHLASTLSQRGSNNDFEFTNRNGTQYNTNDDFTDLRRNAEFHQMSGAHSLRVTHETGAISQLWVQHNTTRAGIPGNESSQTTTAGTRQDELRGHYQWSAPFRANWQPQIAGFAHSSKSSMHWYYPLDKIGVASDDTMESGSISQGGGLRLALDYRQPSAANLFASFYAEGSGAHLESRDYSSHFNLQPWEMGHSQGQMAIHTGFQALSWLQLESEGQYRFVRDQFTGGTMNSTMFENLTATDVRRHLGSGRLALQAGPQEAPWRFFASGGHYFRAPEPLELYGVGGGLLPNPDLEAELGTQLETGWSFRKQKTQLSLALFYNQARNRIVWVTSGSLTKPFNLSKTTNQGLEAQVSGSPFKWLDLQANATWQDPRDQSGHSSYQEKVLPDEPLQAYAASTILHLPKTISLQWNSEARSRLYRDRANRERIPPQQFHHLTLSAQPWTGALLRLSALNLGDAEYQNIYSAYPTPGRQYVASITQQF